VANTTQELRHVDCSLAVVDTQPVQALLQSDRVPSNSLGWRLSTLVQLDGRCHGLVLRQAVLMEKTCEATRKKR